jgi:hypothetical protein
LDAVFSNYAHEHEVDHGFVGGVEAVGGKTQGDLPAGGAQLANVFSGADGGKHGIEAGFERRQDEAFADEGGEHGLSVRELDLVAIRRGGDGLKVERGVRLELLGVGDGEDESVGLA